jgi:hypothetical protein
MRMEREVPRLRLYRFACTDANPTSTLPPQRVVEDLINIRIDAREFDSILYVYIESPNAPKYPGLRRKTAK